MREGCSTGKWLDPNFPKRGWECVEVEDLAKNSGWSYAICEMCEKQEIRYVHSMHHQKTGFTLDVGCVCAENMEQSNAGKKRENMMKRVATFCNSHKWYLRKNCWHLRLNERVRVAIIPDKFDRGGWVPGICINDAMTWGVRCESLLDAKRALWNRLNPGKLPVRFKLYEKEKAA